MIVGGRVGKFWLVLNFHPKPEGKWFPSWLGHIIHKGVVKPPAVFLFPLKAADTRNDWVDSGMGCLKSSFGVRCIGPVSVNITWYLRFVEIFHSFYESRQGGKQTSLDWCPMLRCCRSFPCLCMRKTWWKDGELTQLMVLMAMLVFGRFCCTAVRMIKIRNEAAANR